MCASEAASASRHKSSSIAFRSQDESGRAGGCLEVGGLAHRSDCLPRASR